MMAVSGCLSVLLFVSEENISTVIRWIAIKMCKNIKLPWRMNANDFGDPLTFLSASPLAQNVTGFNKLF